LFAGIVLATLTVTALNHKNASTLESSTDKNLEVSFVSYDGDVDQVESALISATQPLLNIMKNENPHTARIQELGWNCVQEAERAKSVSRGKGD
jgi:hypothetical protein